MEGVTTRAVDGDLDRVLRGELVVGNVHRADVLGNVTYAAFVNEFDDQKPDRIVSYRLVDHFELKDAAVSAIGDWTRPCGSCEEPVGASKSRCPVDGPLCRSCAYDLLGSHYRAVQGATNEDEHPSGHPPTCPECGGDTSYYTEPREPANYYRGEFAVECCGEFEEDRIWES